MTRLPFLLATAFILVIQGLSLRELLPAPVALLAAAGWALMITTVALLIGHRPRLHAWTEDFLIALGSTAMAGLAFGGAIGILMLNTALGSSSITGETLVLMFLPSIPIAIAANAPTELLVLPALLILTWRPGPRRPLLLSAAILYFVHRIWTYLVFAADRLDFAAAERSTTPLTPAERDQFRTALHLDDPRWILNLLIFALFLAAAFVSKTHNSLRDSSRQTDDWRKR